MDKASEVSTPFTPLVERLKRDISTYRRGMQIDAEAMDALEKQLDEIYERRHKIEEERQVNGRMLAYAEELLMSMETAQPAASPEESMPALSPSRRASLDKANAARRAKPKLPNE